MKRSSWRRSGPAKVRRTLLIAFALGLTSCAGRAENVIFPVAADTAGTSSVDLIVATTRRSVDTPGELYSGERGSGLTFANIVVSIPPDSLRKRGEVQWPARSPGNPANEFVSTKVARLDFANTRKWLDAHAAATRKIRVLVFVHGFNNRFDDSVYRFAQLVHDSGADVTPILFTWPSRGSVFAYGYDRESTNVSRDALERVLDMVARDPAVGEIDILAHSMGNWLVLETLRQMAIRNRHIPTKIDDVVLASPDVDVDVFWNELSDMGSPRPRLSLIISRDDHALAASKWIWGNVARLGSIDPEAEPYKSRLAAAHVRVYDLTTLNSEDTLNHNKFAASPEVVRLIGQRLEAGNGLSDTHETVADGIIGEAAREVGALETAIEGAEAPVAAPPVAK
jgi:esterase/lipase superfamily enzyme